MFDQLYAGIAQGFSEQFGGPFADAEAVWPGVPTRDDAGRIVTPGNPTRLPCQAQVSQPTREMRADAEFLQTDMRIIILAASLQGDVRSATEIVVQTGPHAGRWKPEAVTLDTVGFAWSCRGRKIKE